MIFATFWMCMLKNADWQIFIATIGKKSREALTNRWQRKLKLKKKNIFHRRLTRLLRQPVKRDINGVWKSPTTPRQIVGVVAFFHSFFMHIQSFSLSHLYSAMNACDILPLKQVLLSAICFLLLWPHLELGGCYPAVWWRWWIEPIRTDELEVFLGRFVSCDGELFLLCYDHYCLNLLNIASIEDCCNIFRLMSLFNAISGNFGDNIQYNIHIELIPFCCEIASLTCWSKLLKIASKNCNKNKKTSAEIEMSGWTGM